MDDPIPDNNEFEAAEKALRKLGSNLWFGGLSEEWQEYLRSHTVDLFDTYEITVMQAAQLVLNALNAAAQFEPDIMQQEPSESVALQTIIAGIGKSM